MNLEAPLIPRLDHTAFAKIHPELFDLILPKVIEIACKYFDDSLYKQRCLMLKGWVQRQLTHNDFTRRVRRFISEHMFSICFLKEDFKGLVSAFAQEIERMLYARLGPSVSQNNRSNIDVFFTLKTLRSDEEVLKKVVKRACERPLSLDKETEESRELLVEVIFEALFKACHMFRGSHDRTFESLGFDLYEWVVVLENVIWMNTFYIRRMNKGMRDISREFISDLGNGLFDESVEDFVRGILERAYRSVNLSTSGQFFDGVWSRLTDPYLPFYEQNRVFANATMLFWAVHDYLDERWLVESLKPCLQEARHVNPLEKLKELEGKVANQIVEKIGAELMRKVLNPFIQDLKCPSFTFNLDKLKRLPLFDFQLRGFLASPFFIKLNESILFEVMGQKRGLIGQEAT